MERNLMMPGNPRYQPKGLIPYFGYDNLYNPVVQVEIATLETLGEIGIVLDTEMLELTNDVIERALNITTTEVDELERKVTHHDIRALVRLIQEVVGEKLAKWIHVPLTSYDPLETGRALQFLRAYRFVTKPAVKEVARIWIELVREFADQIQIGRTHGQHALPITIGFWLATILYRIVYNLNEMNVYSESLRGKIAGAVGAHNAQIGLGFSSLCDNKSFEARVLEKLGLQPAPISTQILPPEPLAYFLFSCCSLSAALGQFGRDCRHLMRSEIAEIAEEYEEGQVGSSTMAQKRNPINFENIEGMWLRTKSEFGKVLDCLISEHQRDLVGSSLMRDFPIIVINLQQQLDTLLRKNKAGIPFLQRIKVDSVACERNFALNSNVVLAEPLYIALLIAGFKGDAHEFINSTLVPLATKEKIPLIEALEELAKKDGSLKEVVVNIPTQTRVLLYRPDCYTGDAHGKSLEIADWAEEKIKTL